MARIGSFRPTPDASEEGLYDSIEERLSHAVDHLTRAADIVRSNPDGAIELINRVNGQLKHDLQKKELQEQLALYTR
jgi:hypothetical protein